MKKTKRNMALYDPYLDTMGGGEKHILSILKIFDEKGYRITIFWDEDMSKKIYERFRIRLHQLSFVPNIFKNKQFPFSTLQTLRTLQTFDYFIYITDGSYFFSSAKRNYVFAMVPQRNLYTPSFLNRLKLANASFIANSRFTQSYLRAWGIKSEVIYPYVEDRLFATDLKKMKKEKIILSVGRFFPHLHSKKMDTIIRSFKTLKKMIPTLNDYKLIVVGGLKKEDETYFHSLQKTAGGDSSIVLRTNISHDELIEFYQKSEIYWHFTGFGADYNRNPELVEHLGIAPLEAMAAGCIPFCVRAGGPKEIITENENGFLFKDEKELAEKTSKILSDTRMKASMMRFARTFVKNNFSYGVFRKKVLEFFSI